MSTKIWNFCRRAVAVPRTARKRSEFMLMHTRTTGHIIPSGRKQSGRKILFYRRENVFSKNHINPPQIFEFSTKKSKFSEHFRKCSEILKISRNFEKIDFLLDFLGNKPIFFIHIFSTAWYNRSLGHPISWPA